MSTNCALCLIKPAEVPSNMDNISDICVQCDENIQEHVMKDDLIWMNEEEDDEDEEYMYMDEETEDFSDF